MVNKISTLYTEQPEPPRRTMADVFGEDVHGTKIPHGMPEPTSQTRTKKDLLADCDSNIAYLEKKVELTQKQLAEWIARRDQLLKEDK